MSVVVLSVPVLNFIKKKYKHIFKIYNFYFLLIFLFLVSDKTFLLHIILYKAVALTVLVVVLVAVFGSIVSSSIISVSSRGGEKKT